MFGNFPNWIFSHSLNQVKKVRKIDTETHFYVFYSVKQYFLRLIWLYINILLFIASPTKLTVYLNFCLWIRVVWTYFLHLATANELDQLNDGSFGKQLSLTFPLSDQRLFSHQTLRRYCTKSLAIFTNSWNMLTEVKRSGLFSSCGVKW